jgi:putative holliday junction resolvase
MLISMKNSIISIDYGTRKSGLAYSVEGFCFAYKTIPTTELMGKVPKWVIERKAESIVVGMPYNIDGSMSRHGKRVLEFVRKLQTVTPLPIILHDERLSTSEALLGFDEDGITDGDVDAEAARLILMDFLREK